MKKPLLAYVLALMSISTQGLHASQMAADYLGKFKLLSAGFPDMNIKSHYAALRTGCENASWLAKSPAVQNFVKNNFNMIVGTTGGIIASVVSFFAVRSICRWRNDKNFDAQFNADPVFRKQAFKAALNASLLQWTQDTSKQWSENTIPLRADGRYRPVGCIAVHGMQTAFSNSKPTSFSPENVLYFQLLNAVNQKSYGFELHKMAGNNEAAQPVAASSNERSLVIPDDFNTRDADKTPITLLTDAQYREQLVELLADYLERLPDNRMGPQDLIVSNPMQTIDISNDATISADTRLALEDAHRKVIHPDLQGWGVGMTAISTRKALKALMPQDASYLVAQDGALKQRVSVEIKDEMHSQQAQFLDYPHSAKITLGLGGPRLYECIVFNAGEAQVRADWDEIKGIIVDTHPLCQSANKCLKLTRMENGKYAFGEPEIKTIPPKVWISIPNEDGAASSNKTEMPVFVSNLPHDNRVQYYAITHQK